MAVRPGRAARAERTASLRVLPGGRRRAARAALVPVAALLVLAVFGTVAIQALLSQEGFKAARLERSLRRAEEEHALLRARVAELSSPSRLEAESSRMGLRAPADPVYLPVPELDVSGEAANPDIDYSSKRLITEAP